MRPLCGPEPFTKRMLPSAAVSFSMPPEIDKAKALLYTYAKTYTMHVDPTTCAYTTRDTYNVLLY